jgi:hypothetical protein
VAEATNADGAIAILESSVLISLSLVFKAPDFLLGDPDNHIHSGLLKRNPIRAGDERGNPVSGDPKQNVQLGRSRRRDVPYMSAHQFDPTAVLDDTEQDLRKLLIEVRGNIQSWKGWHKVGPEFLNACSGVGPKRIKSFTARIQAEVLSDE